MDVRGFQEVRDALVTSHVPVRYDYVELSPTAFLSVTAALTPFSNHNQSPRYENLPSKKPMGIQFGHILSACSELKCSAEGAGCACVRYLAETQCICMQACECKALLVTPAQEYIPMPNA